MATTTNIFPTAPSSYFPQFYINNPSAGWSVSGDNNPSTDVTYSADSKYIYVNLYDSGAGDSPVFSNFGISGIATYCTITSLTMYTAESRSGTGAGAWKMQHAIGGSYVDAIAAHNTGTSSSGSMSRPGGGSWTRTDLSSLQMKVVPTNWGTASRNSIIDQWYVAVVWDYISLTSLVTNDATSVTGSSATISGSYNANGDGGTEWRMVYGTSTGSYDSPAWTAASGTGSITAPTRNLSSLSAGTTYYYRLEARNSADTAQYGSEKTFTTAAGTKGSRMMMMG